MEEKDGTKGWKKKVEEKKMEEKGVRKRWKTKVEDVSEELEPGRC